MLDPRRSLAGLESAAGAGWFCDVQVGPGWRALLIDTYDVAVRRDEAQALDLRRKLLREARDSGQASPAYLTEHKELNGAVGGGQLAWLRSRLDAAAAARERAIVLAHAALRP